MLAFYVPVHIDYICVGTSVAGNSRLQAENSEATVPYSRERDPLEELIEVAAARLRAEKRAIANRLATFPLSDLQAMGESAEAGNVSDFSAKFLGSCVWLQVGAEIKRRMEGMRDGTITGEEALTGESPSPLIRR